MATLFSFLMPDGSEGEAGERDPGGAESERARVGAGAAPGASRAVLTTGGGVLRSTCLTGGVAGSMLGGGEDAGGKLDAKRRMSGLARAPGGAEETTPGAGVDLILRKSERERELGGGGGEMPRRGLEGGEEE